MSTTTGPLPVKNVLPKSRRASDERLAQTSGFVKLLRRPESGVFMGLIATVPEARECWTLVADRVRATLA